MSPNVLQLLPNALSQPKTQILFARVSANQPLPLAASDPLYVVIPDIDNDLYWKIHPGFWAPNGTALPAASAQCLLIYDNRQNLWCVQWASA